MFSRSQDRGHWDWVLGGMSPSDFIELTNNQSLHTSSFLQYLHLIVNTLTDLASLRESYSWTLDFIVNILTDLWPLSESPSWTLCFIVNIFTDLASLCESSRWTLHLIVNILTDLVPLSESLSWTLCLIMSTLAGPYVSLWTPCSCMWLTCSSPHHSHPWVYYECYQIFWLFLPSLSFGWVYRNHVLVDSS